MNLFKHNKKEETKTPTVDPMLPTETINTGENKKVVENEVAEKFTMEAFEQAKPVVEETEDRFKYYIRKYHNAFTKDDTDEPNIHNLLFGIVTELKELKEVIKNK